MTTLIFLATAIAILVLFIRVIVNLIHHQRIVSILRTIAIIILSYTSVWIFFYFLSTYKIIPLGTDICFDDWCATITKFERPQTLRKDNQLINSKGQFIILYIKMTNQAKRIDQKPSEPRVHIIDGKGHSWSYSLEGQKALEELIGKQIPLDERLKLHQSLETQIVFDIPKEAKNLKVLIEEGPFITKLLFNENKEVFFLQ